MAPAIPLSNEMNDSTTNIIFSGTSRFGEIFVVLDKYLLVWDVRWPTLLLGTFLWLVKIIPRFNHAGDEYFNQSTMLLNLWSLFISDTSRKTKWKKREVWLFISQWQVFSLDLNTVIKIDRTSSQSSLWFIVWIGGSIIRIIDLIEF